MTTKIGISLLVLGLAAGSFRAAAQQPGIDEEARRVARERIEAEKGAIPAAAGMGSALRPLAAPINDHCLAAIPLPLGQAVPGTLAEAADDTELALSSSCFAGIGQTASTMPGRDVSYRFIAPAAAEYSFRVTTYSGVLSNFGILVAADCPFGSSPAIIASCLGASARNALLTPNASEEVVCLPLGAGEQVWVYVDETSFSAAGSSFFVEVTSCAGAQEVEPNDTPAAANPVACGIEGSANPAGEADFLSLGTPDADSRVFAMIDGLASNSADFDIRVTTNTDTLEYDDANADAPFGAFSSVVAGTPVTGTETFLRVSHFGAITASEPWRLFSVVQPPPSGSAVAESEPNDSTAEADFGASDLFTGTIASPTDVDLFVFRAEPGEIVFAALDADPAPRGTPFNGTLALLDSSGALLLSVNDGASASNTTPGTGSLVSSTPNSPAEGLVWRVRLPDRYFVRVGASSAGGTLVGDYLLSIARSCTPGGGLAAPTLTPTEGIARSQGSSGTLVVASVSDPNQSEGTLSVSAGTPVPAGIAISNLLNVAGSVTARIDVDCAAPLVAYTIPLGATDADGMTASADLVVVVDSANPAPLLGSWGDSRVVSGEGILVAPSAAPADNALPIPTLSVGASGFAGSLSIHPLTGVVTVSSASPVGSFPVSIRATDACGASSEAGFDLVVTLPELSGGALRPLRARTNGSDFDRVDLLFEDLGSVRYDLYVATSAANPMNVESPFGRRDCNVAGVVSGPPGYALLPGWNAQGSLTGDLFLRVTADQGSPTEGPLGTSSTGAPATATSYCGR
jgi:hypothetical protein